MEDNKDTEIRELNEELGRARERERDYVDARRAMLYMLEDINKTTADMERSEARLKEEVIITANLLSIAEATARTKDIDSLLGHTVKATSQILRAQACLSYLKDRETGAFMPGQAYGLSAADVPFFRTESLDENVWFVKSAVEKKDAFVASAPFDKKGNEPDSLKWLFKDNGAMLVIPLMHRTGATGILLALYGETPVFTESDWKVIKGVYHQVSTAVEEAVLYNESVNNAMELSRKIETIKVMHEMDRSMLSTLETQEILEVVTGLVSKLVPCDRGTVVTVDRERKGFVYTAGFGIDMPKGLFTPFSDTSAADMVETGRAEFTPNLGDESKLLPLEKSMLDAGFRSHIRVPISVKGEVSALLTVGSKSAGVFNSETLKTLENLAAQIGVALENARLVADLQGLFLSTIKALSKAIDAKSPWTQGHSERVTAIALKIAKKMGVGEMEKKNLEIGGLLHDIGKLGTYEAILNKPGKLTDEETEIIKQHPAAGAAIVEPIKQLKGSIPCISYHHEFYDGSGYPDGLKGDAIPFQARILCVADTVDAMSADRPYRKGRPPELIVAELKRCSGTQFDPQVVNAFISTIEKGMSDGYESE